MCLKSKIAEWDEGRDVKQMWKQVKRAKVNSAREVCGSMRGGKNPKYVWWHGVVKAAVEIKEDTLKEKVARNEIVKERCMEV